MSGPIVGDVVGFAPRWDGRRDGVLWISGDTVLFGGVREVADRLRVGVALLHPGGVRFPVTGPVRYTLTARQAVDLCRAVRPKVIVPVRYEGWQHFRQSREVVEREFAGLPVRWLQPGTPTGLDGLL